MLHHPPHARFPQSTAEQQCAALERSLERAKQAAEDTRTALAKAARAQDIDAANNEVRGTRPILMLASVHAL